jgi:hypothetical protein
LTLTHLIVSERLCKLVAVQVQVDVSEAIQQLLRFPAVTLGVANLQVVTLGSAQLLQVEVKHCCQAVTQLLQAPATVNILNLP